MLDKELVLIKLLQCYEVNMSPFLLTFSFVTLTASGGVYVVSEGFDK
jgi:hypothetical protein